MSDDEQFGFDVFISYSSKDKEWVRGELLEGLEKAGIKAFIDFRDFKRGAPSIKECERGVVSSRKTLLILTPNYVGSGWGELENVMVQTLDPANERLRLIPLLKSECRKPLRIGTLTHIDFTDDADQDLAWRQLFDAVGRPTEQRLPIPQQTTERFWQYVNWALATVFLLLACVWSYRVLGVLAVSLILAGIFSTTGVTWIVAFLFPKLGFRERIRQIHKLLQCRRTAIALLVVYVVGGLMSFTGTTIKVASLPQSMKEIQIIWGADGQTSQDTLSVNQPKWFWTWWKSTPVMFVSPGFRTTTRSVAPWIQTVFYGRDDLKHQPFVVVRIGNSLPPSVPGRNDGAEFRWSLQVTSHSAANPSEPAVTWAAEQIYYVGDPIWLGGDGQEWPPRSDTPAGIEYDQIFRSERDPCVLSANNDYVIKLLDQNGVVQHEFQLSHTEVADIRTPVLKEFVKP